jgi:ribA/ribD-fused uncharacterized protein
MIIYTDGSKIDGPDGLPYAGIGIWFGPNDIRNASIPVFNHPRTNQVAELLAIRYTLIFCKSISDLVIRSDSQYSIKSVTEWHKGWIKNGWKTSGGKSVSNLEIIQSMLALISTRDQRGYKTTFEHVYGHKGEVGNEAADKLAVLASHVQLEDAMANTIYFYNHRAGQYRCFSQFHLSGFSIDIDEVSITFNSAEQHHHYRKAILFNDCASASKIMQTSNPADQKRLGRQVSGFDNDIWMQHCKEYCKIATIAKFTQNVDLGSILKSTRGKRLVEAAPTDPIWGIGISESDAISGHKWKGTNLLGNVLMDVRDTLFG